MAGALLLAAGLVLLLTALTLAREGLSPLVLGLFGFSTIVLAAFVRAERRTEHPVVPFSIFTDPTVRVSVIVSGLAAFAMMGTNIYVPLAYQAVLGLSATESGLYLAPRMMGMVAASLVSGQIVSRIDPYARRTALARNSSG